MAAMMDSIKFCHGVFYFEVEGIRFAAHKELVQGRSETLKAMMKNGMQESQTGVAVITDTTIATFSRFLEFLYTGDYHPAQAIKADVDAQNEAATLTTSRRGNIGASPSRKRPCLGLSLDSKQFNSTTDLNMSGLAKSPLHSVPDSNKAATGRFDYTPEFLSHAELYAFADKYQVDSLRALTAARLGSALFKFLGQTWFAKGPTDLTILIRYVYEHTADRTSEIDVLRKIVIQCYISDYTRLRGNTKFHALLCEGGCFCKDLFLKMKP